MSAIQRCVNRERKSEAKKKRHGCVTEEGNALNERMCVFECAAGMSITLCEWLRAHECD